MDLLASQDWPPRIAVKEQAASRYAAGDAESAQKILIEHLNQTNGNCDPTIWYMLFDLYWVLQQQSTFERLAVLFSEHFGTSPPPWMDREVAQASPLQIAGKNAMVIEGSLTKVHPEKLRELIHQGRQMGWIRLDMSRAVLTGTPEEIEQALMAWDGFMRRIRKQGSRVLLMGEYAIVDRLRQVIDSSGRNMPEAWHVLMEFLQWRGQEDAHDALSESYLAQFDRSPPGFEPHAVLAISPQEAGHQQSPPPSEIMLPEDATIVGVPDWVAATGKAIKADGQARIDLLSVRRLTFEAAAAWSKALSEAGWSRHQVVLLQPTELVGTILDMAGVSAWATMRPRRR